MMMKKVHNVSWHLVDEHCYIGADRGSHAAKPRRHRINASSLFIGRRWALVGTGELYFEDGAEIHEAAI